MLEKAHAWLAELLTGQLSLCSSSLQPNNNLLIDLHACPLVALCAEAILMAGLLLVALGICCARVGTCIAGRTVDRSAICWMLLLCSIVVA